MGYTLKNSDNASHESERLLLTLKKESVDKPGSVADNHSSGTCVTACLKQPTRIPYGPHVMTFQSHGFLFGLAPSGVFPATTVASRAVRSYRTISPLPLTRRYIFCGTFRRFTPPRRYLALCPLEPGLSSLCLSKERLSNQLCRR